MMEYLDFKRFSPLLALAGLFVVEPSEGQMPGQSGGHFETRSELTTEMQAADSRSDRLSATLIRNRLARGDFQEGDRIVVKIEGAAGISDTLTVRSGKRLEIPQMGEIPLEGILRSELTPELTTHVARYLRNPIVHATPLVRIGILGSVARPGYYYTSAEVPLTDVLMTAGGPTADADLNKTTVRRGAEVIVDERKTQTALRQGVSLDMLHMSAGDAIEVGRKAQFNWVLAISTVTTVVGLLFAVTR